MSDIDPYSIAKRLLTFGEDYADKRAAADFLAETKHSVLSELASECTAESQAAKEAYGRRHKKFKEHIKNMVEADRLANRAKAKLEAERVRIEMLRTKSANEREINRSMP